MGISAGRCPMRPWLHLPVASLMMHRQLDEGFALARRSSGDGCASGESPNYDHDSIREYTRPCLQLVRLADRDPCIARGVVIIAKLKSGRL